jgi:hypothetical protein
MDFIKIKTLIDVTNTQVIRLTQGTQLEIDQNRNFSTLRQCVEMRSVIDFYDPPTVELVEITEFGSAYTGKQLVWTFSFIPDRPDVYTNERGDKIGYLIEDLHEVPVILKLTESINIITAMFDCKHSQYKNTIIQASQGINK